MSAWRCAGGRSSCAQASACVPLRRLQPCTCVAGGYTARGTAVMSPAAAERAQRGPPSWMRCRAEQRGPLQMQSGMPVCSIECEVISMACLPNAWMLSPARLLCVRCSAGNRFGTLSLAACKQTSCNLAAVARTGAGCPKRIRF